MISDAKRQGPRHGECDGNRQRRRFANVVAGPTYADGKFSVTFAVSGVTYTVQYAEGSAAPPWNKLANYTAGTNGLFTVEDTATEYPPVLPDGVSRLLSTAGAYAGFALRPDAACWRCCC